MQCTNDYNRLLIVGAGPAGLALSIEARSMGFEVLLVDRKRSRNRPYSELLSGKARCHLQRLDILDEFAGEHKLIHGHRVRWGSAQWREVDSIFSPYGSSWLIDRSRLDRI